MGFMDNWERWSEAQWEKWGSKLQGKYDKYRNMKTPEWYIKITDKVWEELDDKAKAFLNKLVTESIKQFDDEFAKKLIAKVLELIKKG